MLAYFNNRKEIELPNKQRQIGNIDQWIDYGSYSIQEFSGNFSIYLEIRRSGSSLPERCVKQGSDGCGGVGSWWGLKGGVQSEQLKLRCCEFPRCRVNLLLWYVKRKIERGERERETFHGTVTKRAKEVNLVLEVFWLYLCYLMEWSRSFLRCGCSWFNSSSLGNDC